MRASAAAAAACEQVAAGGEDGAKRARGENSEAGEAPKLPRAVGPSLGWDVVTQVVPLGAGDSGAGDDAHAELEAARSDMLREAEASRAAIAGALAARAAAEVQEAVASAREAAAAAAEEAAAARERAREIAVQLEAVEQRARQEADASRRAVAAAEAEAAAAAATATVRAAAEVEAAAARARAKAIEAELAAAQRDRETSREAAKEAEAAAATAREEMAAAQAAAAAATAAVAARDAQSRRYFDTCTDEANCIFCSDLITFAHVLPSCSHAFCYICITEWLENCRVKKVRASCSVCVCVCVCVGVGGWVCVCVCVQHNARATGQHAAAGACDVSQLPVCGACARALAGGVTARALPYVTMYVCASVLACARRSWPAH